jgi:surface carbohydrate biosynthesis protein
MGELKRTFPRIHFISVQNGTRGDFFRSDLPRFNFDLYYSFGEIEWELMKQVGQSFEQSPAIGSLRLGTFYTGAGAYRENSYDLCFISEFVPSSELQTDDKWYREIFEIINIVEKRLFGVALNFSIRNNLKLCIAMRQPLNGTSFQEEYDFFLKDASHDVKIFPREGLSSYDAVKSSRLTICVGSTLGYEGLGMRNRVIFAMDAKELTSYLLAGGIWDSNLLTQHLPDLIRLRLINDEEFSIKAKKIMEMSDNSYAALTEEARRLYMNFDENNLPQEIIKNKISQFLL